jgi:hypothetical protein
MAVFSQAEIKKFEERVVIHLNKFFPRQCEALGESKLRETIRYGIKRAAGYGITAARDVCKYIDVMVALGRDFDTDKKYPWAGEILKATSSSNARMARLIRTADTHLRHA